MCAFKYNEVKSDKILLKKDGIIAYKVLVRVGITSSFRSRIKYASWKNGRMTLFPGTKMNVIPNGKGPGIYAWKESPDKIDYYGGTIVKVILYGRVIEYVAYKSGGYTPSQPAGYMAQRAEILEVL